MKSYYQKHIATARQYLSVSVYMYSTFVYWIYRWTGLDFPSQFKRHARFANWTPEDIPSQEGKIALVTGATSGLGFQTALALAQAGATVIIGGRYDDEVNNAVQKIRALCPSAKVEFGKVDHCSLVEVANFATSLIAKYPCLDILVNNAGIYSPQKRQVTADGFEAVFQINYLSHFALTAQLLPLLRKSSSSPRVVHVSSIGHHSGQINFEDLQLQDCYGTTGIEAYSQTKLANLMFAFELQRRSGEGGWGLTSVGAHPGLSRTTLVVNVNMGPLTWLAHNVAIKFLSQIPAQGAWPQIFAATSPQAKAGGHYGPNGLFELYGTIAPAYISKGARDKNIAAKLWDISCKLANVEWTGLGN